jgi:hypothetical protein
MAIASFFPWLGVVVVGLAIWSMLRPDRALLILSVAVFILGAIHALSGLH